MESLIWWVATSVMVVVVGTAMVIGAYLYWYGTNRREEERSRAKRPFMHAGVAEFVIPSQVDNPAAYLQHLVQFGEEIGYALDPGNYDGWFAEVEKRIVLWWAGGTVGSRRNYLGEFQELRKVYLNVFRESLDFQKLSLELYEVQREASRIARREDLKDLDLDLEIKEKQERLKRDS